MTLSQFVGYLFVLVAAVALDVLLFRWWRRNKLSATIGSRADAVLGRLVDAYGQAADGLRRRLSAVPAGLSSKPNGAESTAPNVPAGESAAQEAAQPDAASEAPAEPATGEASLAPEPTPASQPADAAATSVMLTEAAAPAPETSAQSALTPATAAQVQVTSQSITESRDGLARVSINVELPVGATVRLTIETHAGPQATIFQEAAAPGLVALPPGPQPAQLPAQPAATASARPARAPLTALFAAGGALAPGQRRWWPPAVPAGWAGAWQRLRQAVTARVNSLPLALFYISVGIYLVTRLIGLDQYPIYFFTDEAVHQVLAANFVHTGLRNPDGEFLPTYFSLGPSFNLNGVSVYLQVIPYLIFGPSETVTRATSVLVTLIAAIAVGLILRDIFKRRYWWVATLLLSVTPAWFLHSRTAFEYAEITAYFAGYIYCYLRYRYISPRALYGVVIFGALAFYTHGLGEVLMGVTTLLLAAADWRYHWQQRAIIGRALLLGVVLALPYVRYGLAHPSSTLDELRQRDSYWVQPGLTLGSKLSEFFSEYLVAFSPLYWFQGNNGRDIVRHTMDGYGNLWLPTAPLLALGLLYALRHVRESMHRTVLLALAAAPVGSALVAVGMPRVVWEVIPIVLLTALGLSLALEWLESRRVSPSVLNVGAFVVLAGFNVFLLQDALVNGGLWSQDYTLAGMQYGARQVFGEAIPKFLDQHPDAQVIVSSTWANGTDIFLPFFLKPQQQSHVQLQSLDYFVSQKRDLPPNMEVVLPGYEYDKAVQDPKLANLAVDEILPYPNGKPGFYFLRFTYSANADAVFTAEREELLKPITETFPIDGQNVVVTHPRFGAGQLRDMLDGDRFTLINAPGFNPLALDFAFPAPRSLTGLTLITGSLPDYTVTASLYAPGAAAPQVYTQRYVGEPPDPTIDLKFDQGPATVVRLHLEINNNVDNGPGVNIHIREVQFH